MDEIQIAAYLELFDLPDAFTEAQLKQAYHDLVQVWHPDKHSHKNQFRRLQNRPLPAQQRASLFLSG